MTYNTVPVSGFTRWELLAETPPGSWSPTELTEESGESSPGNCIFTSPATHRHPAAHPSHQSDLALLGLGLLGSSCACASWRHKAFVSDGIKTRGMFVFVVVWFGFVCFVCVCVLGGGGYLFTSFVITVTPIQQQQQHNDAAS